MQDSIVEQSSSNWFFNDRSGLSRTKIPCLWQPGSEEHSQKAERSGPSMLLFLALRHKFNKLTLLETAVHPK